MICVDICNYATMHIITQSWSTSIGFLLYFSLEVAGTHPAKPHSPQCVTGLNISSYSVHPYVSLSAQEVSKSDRVKGAVHDSPPLLSDGTCRFRRSTEYTEYTEYSCPLGPPPRPHATCTDRAAGGREGNRAAFLRFFWPWRLRPLWAALPGWLSYA